MKLITFTHEGWTRIGIADGVGWIENRVIEEPA